MGDRGEGEELGDEVGLRPGAGWGEDGFGEDGFKTRGKGGGDCPKISGVRAGQGMGGGVGREIRWPQGQGQVGDWGRRRGLGDEVW